MRKWKPFKKRQIVKLIRDQLAECEPKQRATFERYSVPLRKAPIERYGKLEQVFIVAQRDNEGMYYEDVEHGFNFSPVDTDGRILQHWCNQDELKYALWHWMEHPQPHRLGPAQPLSVDQNSQPTVPRDG